MKTALVLVGEVILALILAQRIIRQLWLGRLWLGRPHPLHLWLGRPHPLRPLLQAGVMAPSGQLDRTQRAVAPVVGLDLDIYQAPRHLALVRAKVEIGYFLLAVESVVQSHFLHDKKKENRDHDGWMGEPTVIRMIRMIMMIMDDDALGMEGGPCSAARLQCVTVQPSG